MIPRDIESGEQFQVRWEGPGGTEFTRTGTEAQMEFAARSFAEFNPVFERRTITVGPWIPVGEEEDEDDDAADG